MRQWSQPVQAPLNASRLISTTLSAAPDGLLAPGVYFLEATPPGVPSAARHLLLVSK